MRSPMASRPGLRPVHHHRTIPRLLLALGVGVIALHVVVGATGLGGDGFRAAFAQWFQPLVYFGTGAATLARAALVRRGRAPWILLGGGLLLYGSGSVYYNLAYADAPAAPFPSPADALWLGLSPMALAAILVLARHRFPGLRSTVWLDGVIGGAVVAAIAAAALLQPVFDLPVADGAGAIAR